MLCTGFNDVLLTTSLGMMKFRFRGRTFVGGSKCNVQKNSNPIVLTARARCPCYYFSTLSPLFSRQVVYAMALGPLRVSWATRTWLVRLIGIEVFAASPTIYA